MTIGLKQALYTVGESSGSLTVCYEILAGRTATRSISMNMRTVPGDAEGAYSNIGLEGSYVVGKHGKGL